ncbi:MAG: winged helix-turn-helix domain-containing protein [Thermoprotei archaeon]
MIKLISINSLLPHTKRKRRNSPKLIYEILKASTGSGDKKTHILNTTMTGAGTFTKYVTYCLKLGLLEFDGKVIRTSDKGLAYITAYEQYCKQLEELEATANKIIQLAGDTV